VVVNNDGDGNRVQKFNGKSYWYGYGSGAEALDESDASGNSGRRRGEPFKSKDVRRHHEEI
jgi:hypothetical protein